jgi:ectoine hydroxylase-related dioxygenase (phytanoyl-CoA dioxygenase family)
VVGGVGGDARQRLSASSCPVRTPSRSTSTSPTGGANIGYVEIVDHDLAGAVPVLMDPGDLLVFDSHLMHCSTDNVSDGFRAAMVFHLAPAGTADRTEAVQGYVSPVNDWVPTVRDGQAVIAPGAP